MSYVLNPQTNRCIRTDSALYRRLVKLGVIKDDLPEVGKSRVYKVKEDEDIQEAKEAVKPQTHKTVVKGKGKNKGYLVQRTDVRPETIIDATVSTQEKCESNNTDILTDLEMRIAQHLGLL